MSKDEKDTFDNELTRDDIVTVIPDPEGNDDKIGGLPNVFPDEEPDLSDLPGKIDTEELVEEVEEIELPPEELPPEGGLLSLLPWKRRGGFEEELPPEVQEEESVQEEIKEIKEEPKIEIKEAEVKPADEKIDVNYPTIPKNAPELIWSENAKEEKVASKAENLEDDKTSERPLIGSIDHPVKADEVDETDENEFYISSESLGKAQRTGAGSSFSDTIDIPIILNRHREDTTPHKTVSQIKEPGVQSEKPAVKATVKPTAKTAAKSAVKPALKVAQPIKPGNKMNKAEGEKKAPIEAEKTDSKADLPMAKKRHVPYFYIIYFALIVLFFVALFITIGVIKGKLADYEASRPYNYVDKVMSEYFEPGDAEALVKLSGYEENPYEDRGEVVSLVESFLQKGAEYYSIASSDEKLLKFAVRAGDLKFAELTMAPTGEHDGAGYDKYDVSSVNLMIAGSEVVNIKAPESAKVFLNGKELTDDYITDTIPAERDRHIPDEVPLDDFVTYEVKGLIAKPEVTALDKYGNRVDALSDGGAFYDIPKTYADMTEEVKERALAAGEALAAYMQLDAAFGEIGQYVDPASDLYSDLATSEVKWANEHNGYDIQDPSVSEYDIWSEDIYSVRVKFNHVLFNWGGNFENAFDTTFYYRWNGYKWLIYDSHVN